MSLEKYFGGSTNPIYKNILYLFKETERERELVVIAHLWKLFFICQMLGSNSWHRKWKLHYLQMKQMLSRSRTNIRMLWLCSNHKLNTGREVLRCHCLNSIWLGSKKKALPWPLVCKTKLSKGSLRNAGRRGVFSQTLAIPRGFLELFSEYRSSSF